MTTTIAPTTTTTTTTTSPLDLRGTWTALITPFRDGALDELALRNLVETQVAGGVTGVVACGSTGETPTLTTEEFTRTVSIVIAQAAGRIPVMVGTGSNDTATAIERTAIAQELGAAAALVVMPWYNKPTQEGLFQHLRQVAAQSALPIVLYNVPGRTGVDLQARTVARLAAIPTIIGIKEASGSVDRVTEIVRLTASVDPAFVVLSGDDSLTLPMMSVGAQGVVSVVSNIVPGAVSALTRAALRGDFLAARTLHLELYDLCDAMFVETNPVPVKAAAELLGLATAEVRLPLVGLAPESRTRVFQALMACRFTAQRIVFGEESVHMRGASEEIDL
ncbi:MAG: 4-hydroxy-tetrahydrodipicolinate synthase, partial [Thermomicrobiales bacterium]